jgi:hypothetical protein
MPYRRSSGGVFYFKMQLTNIITAGFAEMIAFAGSIARIGTEDYDCVQAETQELAELVIGGVDEELQGGLIFKKADFVSGLPVIGQKLVFGADIVRIVTIKTEQSDPTFLIGFTKVGESTTLPTIADPSIPCYHIDGGEVDHPC